MNNINPSHFWKFSPVGDRGTTAKWPIELQADKKDFRWPDQHTRQGSSDTGRKLGNNWQMEPNGFQNHHVQRKHDLELVVIQFYLPHSACQIFNINVSFNQITDWKSSGVLLKHVGIKKQRHHLPARPSCILMRNGFWNSGYVGWIYGTVKVAGLFLRAFILFEIPTSLGKIFLFLQKLSTSSCQFFHWEGISQMLYIPFLCRNKNDHHIIKTMHELCMMVHTNRLNVCFFMNVFL